MYSLIPILTSDRSSMSSVYDKGQHLIQAAFAGAALDLATFEPTIDSSASSIDPTDGERFISFTPGRIVSQISLVFNPLSHLPAPGLPRRKLFR